MVRPLSEFLFKSSVPAHRGGSVFFSLANNVAIR